MARPKMEKFIRALTKAQSLIAKVDLLGKVMTKQEKAHAKSDHPYKVALKAKDEAVEDAEYALESVMPSSSGRSDGGY